MSAVTVVPNRPKGTHIRGADRERLRRAVAEAYEAGSSIRGVAEAYGVAYGTARALLLEAGVRLRSRAGTRGGRR